MDAPTNASPLRPDTLYAEYCEAVRHYSRELNLSRRLLVTQSFAWLSAYGFVLAGKLDLTNFGVWALTFLASLFTLFVGAFHRHHLDFVLTLVTTAVRDLENTNGPWTRLHTSWEHLSCLSKLILSRPALIPILAYLVAAVSVMLAPQ